MLRRQVCLICVLLAVLAACSSPPPLDPELVVTQTLPPTPAVEALQVSDTRPGAARLHVTLPSITFPEHDAARAVQLFLVMADAQGGFSYLLYPANSSGYAVERLDLRSHPLELSLNDTTTSVALWVLAVHNTRYGAAQALGLDTLAASLALGFRNWLAHGDPLDDPLAGVVSASDGVLYEWFAGIDVVGQSVITLSTAATWNADFDVVRSPDGGLVTVYSVQYHQPEGDDATPATAPSIPTAPTVPGIRP